MREEGVIELRLECIDAQQAFYISHSRVKGSYGGGKIIMV